MSKHSAHTTDFIAKGSDFFVAHLDNGGVRVGMVGNVCFDLPAAHAFYGRAVSVQSESEAEDLFDELFGVIG